jgi:hypothetical protein
MSFLDRKFDPPKTGAEVDSALATTCRAAGCDSHLSLYKGPNSDRYCRKHQLECHEYGGLAKGSKPYSFAKTTVCSKCFKDVAELPQVKAITDEVKRNIALRTLIQVDHKDGNHDNNDIDNLQGLCLDCHAVKTTINEDYLNKE